MRTTSPLSALRKVRPPLLRALLLGALVGLVVAAAYAALAISGLAMYIIVTNLTGSRLGEAMIGAAILPICGVPFAFIVGVLPATLLGTLVGLMTGGVLTVLGTRASPATGAWSGFGAGLICALAVHIILARGPLADGRNELGWYLLWIGIPSLLLLAGSIAIGRWLGGADRKSELS